MPRLWATRIVMAAIATTAFVATAAAQDRPPPMAPARDVTVDYDVTQISPAGVTQHGHGEIRTAAGGTRIRVEGMAGGGASAMIFDRAHGRTFVVIDPIRKYMEMPSNTDPFRWGGDSPYVRKGRDMVAGTACTIWETQGQTSGSVCVTDEGVMLRSEANNKDGRTLATATAIRYAPLTEDMFQPPSGYETLQRPGMPAPK
jgi:hypothetical protein